MLNATLIEIPSWGPLNLIEAIWLFSGVGALAFTTAHVRPLYRDWVAAGMAGRPVLRLVAGGYLRRELIRMTQGGCLSAIGVYAALEPPPAPGPARISVIGLVITGMLLALAFLVSAQSWLDWRTRRAVQALIGQGHNGNHHQ